VDFLACGRVNAHGRETAAPDAQAHLAEVARATCTSWSQAPRLSHYTATALRRTAPMPSKTWLSGSGSQAQAAPTSVNSPGVSDRRVQRISACLRLSMEPKRFRLHTSAKSARAARSITFR